MALFSFGFRLGFLDIVTVEGSGVWIILFCFTFETCGSDLLPCTILANVLVGTIVTLGTGSGIVIGETIFVAGLGCTKGLLF